METFLCSVAQKGFFAGPVHFLWPDIREEEPASDAAAELEKLHTAVCTLQQRIQEGDRATEEKEEEVPGGPRRRCGAGKEDTAMGEVVLSILSDDTFLAKAERGIREEHLHASAAIRRAAEEEAQIFSGMQSEYLRSRQDDVRGVARELMAVLDGADTAPGQRSAFAAFEISPAELIAADSTRIGGLLTEKGSASSHAAILAESMGIPYLYGNREAVVRAQSAAFVILDGRTGRVILDPDPETRRAGETRMAEAVKEQEAGQENAEPVSCRTGICANIADLREVPALRTSGADGVGLFRTEFLFMGRDTPPGEEEQYAVYRSVLEVMGNKPVVIRAMDLGSDKRVPWLSLGEENNPALGLRGVRVLLEREEVLRTQLRALLRAGGIGNLKVMFPMITSGWEIDEIRKRIREAQQELEREGIPFRPFALGIMVETPAAAVCAEELAEKVDFFSIGTNDLTQYTLAVDREARGLERYGNPFHEAVFRMIAMTVAAGHRHGVRTCVCGKLGSEPEAVERLIRIGVDELSVPLCRVSETRRAAAAAERRQADGKGRSLGKETAVGKKNVRGAFTKREIAAPADGEWVPMEAIPDAAFSGGKMGRCFGILPSDGRIYAPAAGTVSNIADARHAVLIAADDGGSILVHVGINTVRLQGEPFRLHVQQGEHVERDQLLMEADLASIQRAGLSAMVIVAVLP